MLQIKIHTVLCMYVCHTYTYTYIYSNRQNCMCCITRQQGIHMYIHICIHMLEQAKLYVLHYAATRPDLEGIKSFLEDEEDTLVSAKLVLSCAYMLYIYICIYVYIYVCMYVCIYKYVCTHIEWRSGGWEGQACFSKTRTELRLHVLYVCTWQISSTLIVYQFTKPSHL